MQRRLFFHDIFLSQFASFWSKFFLLRIVLKLQPRKYMYFKENFHPAIDHMLDFIHLHQLKHTQICCMYGIAFKQLGNGYTCICSGKGGNTVTQVFATLSLGENWLHRKQVNSFESRPLKKGPVYRKAHRKSQKLAAHSKRICQVYQ